MEHEPRDIAISSDYSLAIVDILCDGVREGLNLRELLKEPNMPSIGKVYAWMALHPEFKTRYKEARKQRADLYFDNAIDLAMTPRGKDDVPAAKLAVDTLKWAAEKSNPELYGKVDDKGVKTETKVNIILNTGVLNTPAPSDIIVDEFGNFQGFGNDKQDRVDLGGGERDVNTEEYSSKNYTDTRFVERYEDETSYETEANEVEGQG